MNSLVQKINEDLNRQSFDGGLAHLSNEFFNNSMCEKLNIACIC